MAHRRIRRVRRTGCVRLRRGARMRGQAAALPRWRHAGGSVFPVRRTPRAPAASRWCAAGGGRGAGAVPGLIAPGAQGGSGKGEAAGDGAEKPAAARPEAPQTEAPQTDGFVEVDEIQDDHKFKRIFSGWMFAASPGLHGVEHPVYDVWLTDCKGGSEVIHTTPEAAGDTEPPPNADVRTGAQAKPARRKVEPSGQPAPGRAIQTPADMPPGSPIANPARSTPSPASPVQDAPRRAPTRRYYPSDPLSGAADPAGH